MQNKTVGNEEKSSQKSTNSSQQTLDIFIDQLMCPKTHQPLVFVAGNLETTDGQIRYSNFDGVPDLRVSPERFKLDLEWVAPYEEIANCDFSFPTPLPSADLPFHLDAYQASIPGPIGNDRWILEVGCGERHAEKYYTDRGFNYLGTDFDHRGKGPHILSDGHNLPIKDGSFDFYYSMAVYEHLVNPIVAAREAYRVLKPGGTAFGSVAFMYGFHDYASFFHMSHGGIIALFRAAGFESVRIWPGWEYKQSIPEWAFPGLFGTPWRILNRMVLTASDWSYTKSFAFVRKLTGRAERNLLARRSHIAGGLNFAAIKPIQDE